MRIAVIADIHGNLAGLEAALEDIAREQPDATVCLGDVAASGPQPHQVVAQLRELHFPVVMGNADAWLLNPPSDEPQDDFMRRIVDIDRWCIEQLTSEDIEYMQGFQPIIELELGDTAKLLCYHGSPRSYNEVITVVTPDEQLETIFAGHHALIMAGGHTHVQMFRRYKDGILLNPGSIGLPFEFRTTIAEAYNPVRAEYALLEYENGKLSVDLRRVPYEREALVRAANESGMPHTEWWIDEWR
jgi:putative phosphoesterase